MLPVLRTKVSIPSPRVNRVERGRLTERMEEGMKRRLTLVVAPAGYGKTTLMAEWAGRATGRVAWLSLDEADRSPERFFYSLIQAIQRVSPQTGRTAQAMLLGGKRVDREAVVFSLLNDLSEVPKELLLILDDYHSVDGFEINGIVQSMLENGPREMHLGIASRRTPGISLARLRALDQVVDINEADLRFSEPETGAFLEKMGVSLTPEQIAHLYRSTEGWAVGLQLANLALRQQPFDWNIPAGEAYVFDYLAEEVLRREPPEVQEFLKISSLFDRFCLPLVAWVMRTAEDETAKSPAELLEYVEQANLLIFPLDAEGTWFRYHALFAEFLRQQIPPEGLEVFYNAASLWFEGRRMLDESIHYAIHAGDYQRAADLLEGHYIDLIQRGEQAALMEWLTSLPIDLMERRPSLWLAKGWASVVSMDSSAAEACVEKALGLIPPGGTRERLKLRGEAKCLSILAGIFGGKLAMEEEISEASILLSEQDELLQTMMHFNLGLHHVMLGNTDKALAYFAETVRLTEGGNNLLASIIAQVQIGEVRQLRGALGLAERAFQQAIQFAGEKLGERTFLLGMPLVSYAELLRELNRLDESLRCAEQGIAYCQVWQPAASLDGRIALSRLKAGQGRWDEAHAQLEYAWRLAEESTMGFDDIFVATQMVRLNLLQGNISKAKHLIQMYDLEKEVEKMPFHLWEMVQLVLLRARIARMEESDQCGEGVVESLSRLMAESEARGRVTPVIEGSILRAYAGHKMLQHAEAAEDLSRALTLGAQGGYVRIMADEGKPLRHLLEMYDNRITAPRWYVEEIMNLIDKETSRAKTPPGVHREGLTPLTRRELDILVLLAAGKSNQEIAEERVLALNTVKKHVGNILSKMGVTNRTQAVMLAKKLGWME